MGHFNQYNATPVLRTDRQSVTQQETDAVGNQKSTVATQLSDVNHSITTFNDNYTEAVITTAATTVIKTGAGRIRQIRVLGGTLGNVSVFDNTAGSGTIMVPTFSPDKGQVLLEDCRFDVGCTIVTAAATLIVVTFR